MLALGSAAITGNSLGYFDGEELAPFVVEKLPLPLEDVWLFALKLHVIAAVFALPSCLLLLSRTFLRKAPAAHRWLGRVTGGVVLLGLAPSGFYLSLFAKGGWSSTLGFALSGAIVVGAMVQGIRTARAKRFAEHKRWTLHVLAQLSVAVSSRAMLLAFDAANVDPDLAYSVSLWLPVLASAAAVELLAGSPLRSLSHAWRNHEALHRPRHTHPRNFDLRGAAER